MSPTSRRQHSPAGEDLVLLGEVVRPHGIRGEVAVKSRADSLDSFGHPPALFMRPASGGPARPARVTGLRPHKGLVLLVLEGVADRNAAEALRGSEVLARREDLPAPEPGEVFLDDLIGLAVLLPDGSRLGEIVEVQDAGGQELWVVRTEDGREALLPAADELVVELDLDAGRVVYDPPPGLLELFL